MPDTSAISPVTVSLGGGLILDRDDFSIPPGAAVALQNFEPSIKEFILSSSPMYSQQSAIPNEEFGRLQRKFNEYKFINFKEPEIIVLEKLNPITRKIKIEKENYCKLYDGNIYVLYLKKKHEINCEL